MADETYRGYSLRIRSTAGLEGVVIFIYLAAVLSETMQSTSRDQALLAARLWVDETIGSGP